MSNKVYLSAPIAKTVETPDGGREVWGFATLERVDKTGEIADFDGTVKAFEKWSSEVEKRTQGKSKGNVRVMHGATVAGKAIHWEPTETTIADENGNEQTVKAIWTGAYVPPTKPDIIKDIDEGILSAFSIGGSYAKRWWDDTNKAFRFIPELSEYSLVDNPCVPGADITQVISKAVVPWAKDERNLGGEIVSDELEKSRKPAGSFEDLKARLNQAVEAKMCLPPMSWWDGDIVATYPDRVVVYDWPQQKYFELSYEDSNGAITLGDPVEVAQAYVPVEAQKAMQSELEKRKDESEANAKKLEGGDDSFKDGTVETPVEKSKGSEKSLTAEELQKAANAAGVTMEQMHAFFKALNPDQTTDAPTNVTTVDGDGDGDKNKEFPNPPSGDEKINIEGGQKDVKNAEKQTGAEKSDSEGELAKAGKAVSKSRLMHMHHAVNHIKAAMDGTDYGPDQHMQVENDTAGDGSNSGMEAPEVTSKSFTSALHKSVGDFVSTELSKALQAVKSDVEALVKGLPSVEAFDEMKKQLETMGDLVKAIHDTPQPGGVVLGKGSPDVLQVWKSGQSDTKQMSLDQLNELVKSIKDPLDRDRISQEIAKRQMAGVFGNGGNA